MKLLTIFTFVVSIVAYSTTHSLAQVNDRNFKQLVLEADKYVFVDFYADWCRHCKKLMPTIEELVERFADHSSIIDIVKLNGGTDGKIMARKYAPKGFPTLLLFNGKNEPLEFDGMRDIDSLSNFLQLATGIRLENVEKGENGPIVEQVDKSKIIAIDDNNFAELVEKRNTPTIVTFGATWCEYCKNLEPIIENLADEVYVNDPIQFGKITLDLAPSQELKQKYKIETIPTVLLFNNKLQQDPVVFKGEQSYQKLVDSINKYYGLSRDLSGNLLPNSANIKEIDDLAKTKLDIVEIAKEGLAYLSTLKLPTAPSGAGYYQRIFNKLMNGDKSFIRFELLRINSILSNDYDKLPRKTIDSLKQRQSILQPFENI